MADMGTMKTTIDIHEEPLRAGLTSRWGNRVNDRTHGQQFRARFIRASAPSSVEGTEKYHGSDVWKMRTAILMDRRLVERQCGEKLSTRPFAGKHHGMKLFLGNAGKFLHVLNGGRQFLPGRRRRQLAPRQIQDAMHHGVDLPEVSQGFAGALGQVDDFLAAV